jgi:hypothetical protein
MCFDGHRERHVCKVSYAYTKPSGLCVILDSVSLWHSSSGAREGESALSCLVIVRVSQQKYQIPHRYSRLPLSFLTGRPLTSHFATALALNLVQPHSTLLFLRYPLSFLVGHFDLCDPWPRKVPHPPSRRSSFPSFLSPANPLSAQVIPFFPSPKPVPGGLWSPRCPSQSLVRYVCPRTAAWTTLVHFHSTSLLASY